MTLLASISPAVASAIPMTVMRVENAAAISRTAAGFAEQPDCQGNAREDGNEHPFHDTPLMSARPTLEGGMVQ